MTGAAGFVGAHLARRLVSAGAEVHVVSRPGSNQWRLRDVSHNLRVHGCAIEDAATLRDLVRMISPQAVFHLAAATSIATHVATPETLVSTNVAGTMNLIDACATIDCDAIVLAGDSFEYTPAHEPLTETSECRPANLHGLTRLLATRYAQTIARAKGLPIVTLRLFSVFGPGDHRQRLIPTLIAHALAGRPLPLARRDIVRDWVFIEDVVALFIEAARRALEHGGDIFNAGTGVATTLEELVRVVLQLTGSSSTPAWGTFDAPEHDRYPWVADAHRTFATFDWRPATSLMEGLRSTIAAASSLEVPR